MLGRAQIAERIPHGGAMCLLDRVVSWDAGSIRCAAISHRDPANPLREPEGLPVWAGVEYAAQAAAVHGSLVLEGPARAGVLAKLRDAAPACERLDDVESELILEATLLHRDPAGAIYSFAVRAQERVLLAGQFTLMFTGAAP